MASTEHHEESLADIRERQRRERMHRATGYHGGRRVLLCGLFALSLFLAVAALALRQATSPDAARNVLGAGIARITGLDRLLAQDLPNANATGADKDAPPLPGFPIDIQLTHADIAGKSTAEVRSLVLDRASSRVYNDGVKAFDRTGQQSVSRFSGEGLLTSMADQITATNHDRATLALIILVILTAVAAGALVLAAEEGRRGRLVGVGILAAGLPGVLLCVAAWFAIGAAGGSDPFVGALRSLARSVVDVPFRDFAIVTALGVIVLFAGPLVSLAARPFGHVTAEEDESTDHFAESNDDAFDDDYEADDQDEFDDDIIIDDNEDDEVEARV